MKLSILMATYDRLIPYFRCLTTIKPAIYKGSDIKLDIRVDTKLSKFMFYLKLVLTRIILGSSQYTYDWGCDCIGKSRNKMIEESDTEYFMNFDDDDLLNSKNLLRVLSEFHNYDIFNFDYYSDEKDIRVSIFKKGSWIPKYWFDKNDLGLSIGQSSIFRRDLYLSLNSCYRYHKCYVDDMLPNHVMYLEANSIGKTEIQIVKRNRGEKSLMNTTNFEKFAEIIESLDMFLSYLISKRGYPSNEISQLIWKITLSNQLEYHKRKSGERFFNLLYRNYSATKLCEAN